MAMSVQKRWLGALVALLAGFGLLAVAGTEKAGATTVEPSAATTNTTANAVLDPDQFSWFIPDNAYFPGAVGCIEAEADFLIPPNSLGGGFFDFNENNPGVGTYSQDSGGVIMNMVEPPIFEDCAVYNLLVDPGPQIPAQKYNPNDPPPIVFDDVEVETQGKWTVTVDNINGTDVVAAIAVPARGAQITIPVVPGVANCVLNVTQETEDNAAQAALADFYNGDEKTDARLEVDTQIKFTEDPGSTFPCSSLGFQVNTPTKKDAISQYEADYIVTSNAGPVEVLP